MMAVGWPLVNVASQLLDRDEREAVLGDLAEAGENAWAALRNVLGLVVWREAALWTSWRPWLSAFGLALPGSLLLMGASVSVSKGYLRFIGAGIPGGPGQSPVPSPLALLCQVLVLAISAWSAGFVVGVVSRRTLWASGAACFLPCVFCLARFRIESLPSPCLFLFVLPAIWGACQGLLRPRIGLRAATALAIVTAALALYAWQWGTSLICNCLLLYPALYIVATTWMRSSGPGRNSAEG
jgi:hypothetical protein